MPFAQVQPQPELANAHPVTWYLILFCLTLAVMLACVGTTNGLKILVQRRRAHHKWLRGAHFDEMSLPDRSHQVVVMRRAARREAKRKGQPRPVRDAPLSPGEKEIIDERMSKIENHWEDQAPDKRKPLPPIDEDKIDWSKLDDMLKRVDDPDPEDPPEDRPA